MVFLAVEDDPLVATVYRRVLSRFGHVITAETIVSARRWLSQLQLSGLVVDVQLPDGSGLDLAREARARMRELPIVFIAGRVDAGRLDVADELVASYLLKPVDLRQLERFADRAIARQDRRNALLRDWIERYDLSAAEAMTLRLGLHGMTREEIAIARRISPGTVRTQITNLLAKIGSVSLARAAAQFYEELATRSVL